MGKICIYPGSFDPVTTGHMDIIQRSCALFDQVVVAVLHNPHKTGCFTVEERVDMIRRCCRGMEQVRVERFEGMTVDFARKVGACAMIRGLRNPDDYVNEQTLAQINYRLCPEVDTLFLMSAPQHYIVSSSAVRELAAFGSTLDGFVPPEIEADVRRRFAK